MASPSRPRFLTNKPDFSEMEVPSFLKDYYTRQAHILAAANNRASRTWAWSVRSRCRLLHTASRCDTAGTGPSRQGNVVQIRRWCRIDFSSLLD